MNKGTAYGVGVGPGDPELMTLKACRLIRGNDIIALPGKVPQQTKAYEIAAAAVPELADKELISIVMPMIRDRETISISHRKAADTIESYLDAGKNVVYLTLGDPTVYCTFSYIQHLLEADGYKVELVSAVTSFCGAAASLGISLSEWDEPLHIMPALHINDEHLRSPGNYVLMKSASRMADVKDILRKSGFEVQGAENCTMENEHLYRELEEIPDDAGYLTLLVAKHRKD